VDRRENGVYTVPKAELQDKSDRYYVHETLALAAGEIYVSPLDLNVEHGEPEVPERPVIRLGTPIMNGGGAARGLLIVNLHAEVVLDHIRQMAEARGSVVYLFSRAGFYLSRSPDPVSHRAFKMRSLEGLVDTFSRPLLARIVDGQRGTAEQGDWIVAYAPVEVKSSLNGSRPRTMEWAVVLASPRRELFAAVFSLYILYGVLAAGLAATAGAGFLLSRYLLRPLTLLSQETEEIAKGHFTSRVEINGDDEIAELGARFNQMAGELERFYASLEDQKQSLEAEVRARTAALDRERHNLATIIENTADGILSVSRAGIIGLANTAAERLLGGGRLVGRGIGDFWPGWEQHAAADGMGADFPRLATFQAGGRTLALNMAPVLRDGAGHGFILVIRDVSEERRLQDERRELDRQIFQTEKMTAMGELAMGLAHEIGNPLAGMKTVAQALLEEAEESERTRIYLRRIENEIDRLSNFLRTFHGFAAPQEMHPVSCRLEEVLEDVLLWTRREAKSEEITIEYKHCADDVPPLWADPNQLKQVLLNLVINAIHAVGRGGRITVGMCRRDDGVAAGGPPRMRFCVEDTGPGIPSEILPRIFDPFFTTRQSGTGLGLAVVKKIAVQHGADIIVHSAPGEGTRFEFIWPLAPGPAADAAPDAPADRLCERKGPHG
jgi:PAS domain S-box-containing protein